MSRVLFLFAVTLLAVGCSGKADPQPQATNSGFRTGKPDDEEARQCVAAFLAECGYSHVEIKELKDKSAMPTDAKPEGEAWAYTVSMECTDILGGRRQNEGWTVVVQRKEGKANVSTCFDHGMKKISGQTVASVTPEPDLNTTPILIIPTP